MKYVKKFDNFINESESKNNWDELLAPFIYNIPEVYDLLCRIEVDKTDELGEKSNLAKSRARDRLKSFEAALKAVEKTLNEKPNRIICLGESLEEDETRELVDAIFPKMLESDKFEPVWDNFKEAKNSNNIIPARIEVNKLKYDKLVFATLKDYSQSLGTLYFVKGVDLVDALVETGEIAHLLSSKKADDIIEDKLLQFFPDGKKSVEELKHKYRGALQGKKYGL